MTRRELAKAVQNELAEANTVAEESLSSMATVRSHAAEDSARAAYQHRLHLFYKLCVSQSQHALSQAVSFLEFS